MIQIFTFLHEVELQDFLIANFNLYFDFDYICQEFFTSVGRIDLIGEDENNIYIIELKRDIITQIAIEQLDNYINHYESTKNIIGIAAAPEIHSKIDLSLLKNDIRLQAIKGVRCLHDYKHKLRTRKSYTSSYDITLINRLKKLSSTTKIPQSKLLDEAIEDLLKKYKGTC